MPQESSTAQGTKSDDGLLTVQDVVRLLSVDQRTVYRYKAERGLPFFKCGSLVRIRRQDVEAWLRGERAMPALTHSHNGAPVVHQRAPTNLQPQALIPEPIDAPDSAPYSAPRLHDLEARVSVLETFITTLQRQSAQMIGAPNGAPRSAPTVATKKRGFVIACDLSDALDRVRSKNSNLPLQQRLQISNPLLG
jgi:excisionase family DNA binding protein